MKDETRALHIILRRDSDTKYGGDVGQLTKYGDLLSQYGWTVRYSFGIPEQCVQSDVLLLSNIDRPFELLAGVRYAHSIRTPYVISTIHHSRKHLANFAKSRTGLLGLIERNLPIALADYLKHQIRYRSLKLEKDGVKNLFALRRSLFLALQSAAKVLVLSPEEAQWLVEDFGAALSNVHIVPNGMETMRGIRAPRDKEWAAIVVGRIEHRKNQLAVAKQLRALPHKFLFLGPPNDQNLHYVRQFERFIDMSPNLEWIKGVPPSDVSSFMERSRISISASYFEVQSLVDLEAAALGLQVIASTKGSTPSALGVSARYVDPSNLHDLPSIVQALLENSLTQGVEWPSWEEVGSSLADTLKSVIQYDA